MDLIPISKNTLINVDRIDRIEIRKIKGEKSLVITVGGKDYIPEENVVEIMQSLIKHGSNATVKQFFSV